MISEWRECTLGDVVNFRRGHDLPKSKMKSGRYPVMGSNGVIGFHNEFTTKSPCVSIGRSGNVGNPKILKHDCWAHNTTLYIDDFKGNDPLYVYYLLHRLNLANYKGGSAVPTLNRNHIHPIELSIPPLQEQKFIAHILGTLDNKIELNRKMNETLEQMAQALFKSWFVDFDPVFDNAIAKGNPIPDTLKQKSDRRKEVISSGKYKALPKELLELFPSSFEFNDELEKWIPEGWDIGKMEEVVDVKYGKDHKKLEEGDYPCYGSGGIMRYVDSTLCNEESVLIPRKGTLSNIMYVRNPFWSVDTMFFTEFKQPNYVKYLFYFLQKFNFTEMNVGSAVPSMTTKVLNSLNLLQPSEQVLQLFDEKVEHFLSKKEANDKQNEFLVRQRDVLLPQLISGKLRVNNLKSDAL